VQFRPYLVIPHHGEAEVCVDRPVNIYEGRQRYSLSAIGLRPDLRFINETAPNAHSLMFGRDAHLLDVCESVNVVDEQKSNRPICGIAGDETATRIRVCDECFDRSRLVIGDVVR